MGRNKQAWSLIQRNGIWYVRYYEGERRVTKSLKTKSKRTATMAAHKLEAERLGTRLRDKSYQERISLPSEYESHPTLREWVEREQWWRWGECKYIRRRNLRADPDRPAVQKRYADDARKVLDEYLLPHFGDLYLYEIRPRHIEEFIEKDVGDWSRKTVNNHLSVLRTMLREAVYEDLIPQNPFDRVRPLVTSKSERGILTLKEASKVLERKRWTNSMYWLVNLVAATTELRQGEILALQSDDLFSNYVRVRHSWDARNGLGPTKTKRVREIPIPPKTRAAIDELVSWEGFIFSQTEGKRPTGANRCTTALYTVLADVGVDREGRGITFHSWRHWFVTSLRGLGVALHEVQAISGHSTEQMVDHYSHFDRSNFRDVMRAQSKLLG